MTQFCRLPTSLKTNPVLTLCDNVLYRSKTPYKKVPLYDVDQGMLTVSMDNNDFIAVCAANLPLRSHFMPIEKHTLVQDFPEHHHTIRHLKMNDKHFVKLFDEYHQVDNEVLEIEEKNSPVEDNYLETLKRQRLHLKDLLFRMISKTENAI